MTDTNDRRAELIAELAALDSKEAETDTADVVDAVTATAEAVAEAVADNVQPDPPKQPDVIDAAVADTMRIEAEAQAQRDIIDAQADADIRRIKAERETVEAVAEIVADAEPDGDEIPETEIPTASDDVPPAPSHRWFGPVRGGRR